MFFKRKPYPSDLTDPEWEILKPMLPPPKQRGRKRTVDLREIVNAIFYVLHTGCQWDYLPHDFPPTDTVFGYFNQWKNDGTWGKINDALRGRVREQVGKDTSNSKFETGLRRQNRRDGQFQAFGHETKERLPTFEEYIAG